MKKAALLALTAFSLFGYQAFADEDAAQAESKKSDTTVETQIEPVGDGEPTEPADALSFQDFKKEKDKDKKSAIV